MYMINVAISYEEPGKPLKFFNQGDTADLAGWPDLDRMEAEGAITLIIPDAPQAVAAPDVSVPVSPFASRRPKTSSAPLADQPATPDSEVQS